jgi:hypothetical protein
VSPELALLLMALLHMHILKLLPISGMLLWLSLVAIWVLRPTLVSQIHSEISLLPQLPPQEILGCLFCNRKTKKKKKKRSSKKNLGPLEFSI